MAARSVAAHSICLGSMVLAVSLGYSGPQALINLRLLLLFSLLKGVTPALSRECWASSEMPFLVSTRFGFKVVILLQIFLGLLASSCS